MSQTRLHFLSACQSARESSYSELSELDRSVLDGMDDTQAPTPSPRLQIAVSVAFNPKAKLRTSWIYDHIPDEDRETRYYNKTTTALEWRCKYCAQSYTLSSGTNIITKHLTSQKGHGIERNSLRDKRVKN